MGIKKINNFISASEKANNNGIGELYIYGDIADTKWWVEDVTPIEIKNALDNMGEIAQLDVHINSYGGSVFAGNAIVNLIENYKKKRKCSVYTYIEGLAASMASGISTVGDKVYMANNSLYMVHKPLSYVSGNANDLEKEIEILNKVEDTLVANYMKKFNGTEEELRQMLSDETWLTAEEAQDYGLVDEIIDSVEIVASAKSNSLIINKMEFDNSKIADIIKDKKINIKPTNNKEKGETPEMKVYDSKLMDFGIDESIFNAFDLEAEKVLEIVSAVKFEPEPVAEFISKQSATEALGVEDITAEQLFDYAKKGMSVDVESTRKASAYDKIVSDLKEETLKNALKAAGTDDFNENVTKKMLNALDYDELVEQNKIFEAQAKARLNAGKRLSKPIEENKSKNFNPKDYEF